MKRTRIDIGEYQFVGHIIEENEKYVRFSHPMLLQDKEVFVIRNLFKNGTTPLYDLGLLPGLWKFHEYRQEARRSCLITYWIFKKLLGRDLAGLIAKTVWSTRFDFIWENEKEEN